MAVPTGPERIADAVGTILLRANRTHLYDRVTAAVDGVDPTTYPVLSGLARTGASTPSQLAVAAGLERSVTSRYAARLEQAGLVVRRGDPTDARSCVLSLSAAGEDAVATMRRALGAVIGEISAGWGRAEEAAFVDRFEELVAGLTRPGTHPIPPTLGR